MYPHVGEEAAYQRIRDLHREATAERQATQARRARRRTAGMVRILRAFLASVRV
jgi:hypothetical protein